MPPSRNAHEYVVTFSMLCVRVRFVYMCVIKDLKTANEYIFIILFSCNSDFNMLQFNTDVKILIVKRILQPPPLYTSSDK